MTPLERTLHDEQRDDAVQAVRDVLHTAIGPQAQQRIEALTGREALGLLRSRDKTLEAAAATLRTSPENVADAVADRERAAASFAQRHPSYREIRIEPADYRGYEAADWEFTYEGLHVINRVFVVDGTGHSLFFQTRAGDFGAARSDFDAVAAAFRPVGG
jgi:hypothetical protein